MSYNRVSEEVFSFIFLLTFNPEVMQQTSPSLCGHSLWADTLLHSRSQNCRSHGLCPLLLQMPFSVLFGFPFFFLFSWHPNLFHRRSKMFWQDSLEAFWHFTANFVTEEIPQNSLRSVNSTYWVADNVKWMSDLFKWNINRNTDFP